MKPYTVTTEVTTKYKIEVHAETETAAIEQTESLTLDQIQNGGDFVELVGVDATDAELLYPEDEDEDTVSEEDEVEPAADNYNVHTADLSDYPKPVPTPEETGFVEQKPEPIEDAVIMPEDENDHSDQS